MRLHLSWEQRDIEAVADESHIDMVIRHTVKTITFDQINKSIDLLRTGEIVGSPLCFASGMKHAYAFFVSGTTAEMVEGRTAFSKRRSRR